MGRRQFCRPTTPCTAPLIEQAGELLNRGPRGSPTSFLANHTVSASILGLPGISLPVGLSKDGLPIGVELDASLGSDHALLALAQRIEGVLGTQAT